MAFYSRSHGCKIDKESPMFNKILVKPKLDQDNNNNREVVFEV